VTNPTDLINLGERVSPVQAPPVVVAMVVHQPCPWLDEVLTSLAAQDYPNLQTLFFVIGAASSPTVDIAPAVNILPAGNASDSIRLALPAAVIRQVEGNPGYGPLMNEVGRLVEGESGFFCFMHDDVALESNAISIMIEELFRSNAGVVGPKFVMWDDITVLQSVGLGADRIGDIDSIVEPGEKDQEQHDAVRDVFLLPSACMLVRADMFREIGGFSPDIPLFGEDLDFCWRTHLSGARVLVVPAARARHRKEMSVSRSVSTMSALEARHRVRTVATLSSRIQLPIVLAQLIVMAIARVVIGVFNGTFRQAQVSLRASIAVIFDVRYIVRRRAEVRPYRRVSAAEIHGLQSRGSARLWAFIRKRQTRVQEISGLTTANLTNPKSRLVGITALIVIALILIGSRGLIGSGVASVGDFLPLRSATESPTALISSAVSGWWQAGFGQASANPTGIVLLAIAGVGVLGRLGALQMLSVVGALVIGCVGMWQVASGFFSSRARIVGFLVYAAVPAPYVAIAQGRFGVLTCYAALPWLLRLFVRVGQRPVGVQKTQVWALAVLFGAVVAAFAPIFVIVALFASAAWMTADLVSRVRWQAIVAVLQLMFVLVVGIIVLNFPWSGGFIASDWWQQLVGVQTMRRGHIGLATLARMDSGVIAVSILALGLYVPVIIGLLIVRGDKLVWAARSASLVLLSLIAVALSDAGYVDIAIPEYGILFVVVACGLSLAAATMASFIFDDQAINTYRWWKPLASVAIACIMVGVLPALVLSTNGRWGQPKVSLAQLVAQLPTDPASGDYNVVYVGRSEVLPLPAMRLNDQTAFAVADDGELTLRDHWLAPTNALTDSVAQALDAAISQQTVRCGRLLASLGVRYLVVPIIDGAASTVDQPLAAPIGLLEGLSLQLDFRRVYTANDLVIFENMAYTPSLTKLDEASAVLSQQAGTDALLSSQLQVAQVLPRMGDIASRPTPAEVGTIHLVAPFNDHLVLRVDNSDVIPRVAFGGTTAFDSPVAGTATLDFRTPWNHVVLLLVQLILWVLVISATFNLKRIKSRMGVRREKPIVLDESSDSVLTFNKQDGAGSQ
jgi:GT2 family glycosyltransferase